MKLKTLLLLFLAGFMMACESGKIPENFDYGKVENGKYTNQYFNTEITLPANWVVQTQAQMEELSKKGAELVAGDDQKMKAVLKASEVKSANLFGAFQHELGAPVDFNPSILGLAENVKSTPGIKSGKDYLFQTRKLILQSHMQYDSVDENYEEETINGITFYKMKGIISIGNTHVTQIYYTTVINNFALSLIISYNDEEQQKELLKSIQSFKHIK